MHLSDLENQLLEEEHRQKVAAPTIEAIELMNAPSSFSILTGELNELFTEKNNFKSKKFVQDWVNSSPSANLSDPEIEPSLHLSGSITNQIKQLLFLLFQFNHKLIVLELNTHSRVAVNNVNNNVLLEIKKVEEQAEPQNTPPSPAMAFGMPP